MTRQLDDAFLDRLAEYGPIGKTLGMTIRPAFIADKGKTFVWGDWSSIEARVMPWLAASPGGDAKLDIFRQNDADPSMPGVYLVTAGELLGKPPEQVTKDERQSHGKVPELSLQFGGATGALMKMAANYGVYLDEETAKWMVHTWRERNPWAKEFWGTFRTNEHGDVTQATGLWGAALQACRDPGTIYTAGRVAYIFDPNYLGGTLFCALPCGRLLTYPDCRVRTRTVKDKETGEEKDVTALWYRKAFGWSALWYGKLAENITQAVAGSILRETLVALDVETAEFDEVRQLWALVGGPRDEQGACGSTHDEIILEVPDTPEIISAAKVALSKQMLHRPAWRADLPLAVEVTSNWYYTKDPTIEE